MQLRKMIVLKVAFFSSVSHRRPNCKLRKVVKAPLSLCSEGYLPAEEITQSWFMVEVILEGETVL